MSNKGNAIELSLTKPTKIEQIATMLLMKGHKYVFVWSLIGKVKTSNPSAHISRLRQKGIQITKGPFYRIPDKENACRLINAINSQRHKRGESKLSPDVAENYLKNFKQ